MTDIEFYLEQLAYIKQQLDDLLSNAPCDKELIESLEELKETIEHAIEYCECGD
ncbi:hypothetical protein [Sulfolobus spindle-shaped virus]|nr:hypothetical protein [Sulfolobus spindle-shaped virus]AZG03119.1 hypothetical protein [Sulfolobus spindle-shaped virus]AZG03160.1 hypothetical protein [Sulfolobus spindle-shaped virus]AZG03205.1 hypothetical protein [Sulfolobus spindle-shaped virus]AZG03396.1 hypothetical protein [Sulfolobus spindle-shaped virus]